MDTLTVRSIGQHAKNAVQITDPALVESSNAVAHVLAPDYYEAIAYQQISGKEQIAAADSFRDYTRGLTDVDEKLAAIRAALIESGSRPDFTFYDDPIRALWQQRLNPEDRPSSAGASLGKLAAEVFFGASDLGLIEELLQNKKQIVFEGPPGTGKTYVARLFARYLAGLPLRGDSSPQVEIVQFHQSYGYEDFVAGIRPSTSADGTLRYDVQPGIFLEMCQRADAKPDQKFVLIIDEINRGNASRIFGELLYALEYRDEPVRLQYPGLLGDLDARHLVIPSNLYVIGTMNSTDRSLAMIDYALRRRFSFWKLAPIVGDRAPFLEGWLQSRSFTPEEVADITRRFVAINVQISSYLTPDYAIGHSYFMDEGIGEPATRLRIWKYQLEPLLEEYFHNRRDRDDAISALRTIMLDA